MFRLLNSVARVFVKFPAHEVALDIGLRTIPLCASSLPVQTTPILTEVQMNALEALSGFNFASNPSLISPAMQLLVILWRLYSPSLPASCNMKQLGKYISTALNPELEGAGPRTQEAIACAKDFVSSLMRVLSDSQVQALEKEGVYKQLRLLVMHYDQMSAEDLRLLVIGVGTFAEVTSSSMLFLEESSYVGFIQSALKYPDDEALQALIWQMFTLLCRGERRFAEGLFEADILGSILALIKMEGSQVQMPMRFLKLCLQGTPVCISSCLSHKGFMDHILGMLTSYSSECIDRPSGLVATSLCDLLAEMCKSEPANVASILELKILSHLEDCARIQPDVALFQACIAINGVVNCFPSSSSVVLPASAEKVVEHFSSQRKGFSDQDHHLFFKDMLSNPIVCSQARYIKLMYITLQKLLKAFTADATKKLHSKDFLEFFSVCFLRDTLSYPSLVTRVVFSTHYFIFEMRNKEPISFLSELNFHTTVANLLQDCMNIDEIATVIGLVACLVGKYYEFLKDVQPFLKVRIPDMMLDKAKVFGQEGRSVQFCDDFGRIMLILTADKELSMDLYKQGYLNRLVEMIDDKAMTGMRQNMIHATGNIALSGQHIKQILLDQQFYLKLLSILRSEGKSGNSFLISASCRVLHILASGDWAKRKFVECGCVEVLLDVMRVRKDNPEVRWRPLGLLSSLGFMAVTNRRYVLTDDVLEVVASILRESKNGKVISYTTLIFLGIDELDEGARRLRELGVGEHLLSAIDNPEYRKQAPDLERWGVHVLEKQNLYTISTPKSVSDQIPPLESHHPSDWPPYIPLPTVSPGSDSDAAIIRRLLPLEDSCFEPHTPLAPELLASAKTQLAQLGLDPNKPLFRVGRVYGSTYGLCSNCDKESMSEELVIRPLGMTLEQYQHLIDNGWYRRGGVKMFRLRHNHHIECCDWETRVLVSEFDHTTHKSYKKVLRRMPVDRLTVETVPASFNREAFDLYNSYHVKKHDKPLKSEHSYCEHTVNTPTAYETVGGVECGTFHQLYRLDGQLVAIGIIDIIPKGIVSIYMWYSLVKEVSKYSFGVYSALKEIELVKELSRKNPEMKYYYLQGWNGNNKKLNYKANYEPEDFFCPCIVSNWMTSLGEEITLEFNKTKPEGESAETEKPTAGADDEGGKVPNKDGKEASNGEHIECKAFPLDKSRYEQQTGQSTVDVSKTVVCLNYSQYMYLEEVFQRYEVNNDQREIIELRFRELVVALSPELRNQLVIDMMAAASLVEES